MAKTPFTLSRRTRQRVLENIVRERMFNRHSEDGTAPWTDVDMPLEVERIEYWPAGKYSLTPMDVGAIEVTYSTKGYRAIYGFTALGDVACYMD